MKAMRNPLILVLDDDPIFRRIVDRFASRNHLNVVTCKDLAELKAIWRRTPPELAVIDFNLGEEINGTDIARLLGNTPVLLVSRNSARIPPKSTWSANILEYLDKNAGIPTLLDRANVLA